MLFRLTRVLFRLTGVLVRLTRELFRLTRVLFRLTRVLFRLTRVLFRLTRVLFKLTWVLFRLTRELFRLTRVLFRLTRVLFSITWYNMSSAVSHGLVWSNAMKWFRWQRKEAICNCLHKQSFRNKRNFTCCKAHLQVLRISRPILRGSYWQASWWTFIQWKEKNEGVEW